MKIRNEIKIAAPLATTWAALDDIPVLARCAPGAELIEQKEDGSCLGTVAVKLGPVSLKFKGTVSFTEKSPEAGLVRAKAKGSEEKGRGAASADLLFTLVEEGQATRVIVDSDVVLAGAVAQYGRGAALIQGTAQALMDQFARNLEKELSGQGDKIESEISAAKTVAKGVWNAGAQMFRKKDG